MASRWSRPPTLRTSTSRPPRHCARRGRSPSSMIWSRPAVSAGCRSSSPDTTCGCCRTVPGGGLLGRAVPLGRHRRRSAGRVRRGAGPPRRGARAGHRVQHHGHHGGCGGSGKQGRRGRVLTALKARATTPGSPPWCAGTADAECPLSVDPDGRLRHRTRDDGLTSIRGSAPISGSAPRSLPPAERSMVITGSPAEWESWTETAFP